MRQHLLPMPTPTFHTTCTRNAPIARDVYEFACKKPEGFTFQPGQFVLFSVPLVDNQADVQPRAFSIASSPEESDLLFVAKMKEGGRASRWILETLKPGTPVTMQGPMGLFLLDRTTQKDILFICTSTGVAPFRSMIMDTLYGSPLRGSPGVMVRCDQSEAEGASNPCTRLAPQDDTAESSRQQQRIDLVFGARAEEDLFWMEELTALTKQEENFFLHLALSNPSEKWKGHRGRVQTLVPQIVGDFSGHSVYVCGSPDMTKEVKGLCLESWGVAKEDLHVEGYI